jgi:Rieske Fe-S protein
MKGHAVALAEISQVSRFRFILGAGLGLAAGVIAACSSYGKKEPGSSGTSAAPSASGSAQANVITKTADVPVGSGVIVGQIVVTQPTAGVFKGLSAICTHQGCTVSKVADGTIDCPCHGSKFNLDGSVAHGPATTPLETKQISVQGDSIVEG